MRVGRRRRAPATVAVVAALVLLAGALVGATPASAYQFGDDPLEDVLAAAASEARCGLTRDQLAAIALAPTFPETGAGSSRTPSPMTLSRYDNQAGLYAFGDTSTSNPYRNAFWHPGVGAWQFDSAGLGTSFAAHERIDTRVVAPEAVAVMAARYCAGSGTAAQKRSYAWAPWVACNSGQCESIYNALRSGASLAVDRDAAVSSTGGMLPRSCRVGSTVVACWFVDPARAEGHASWAAAQWGRSPVTEPFYSFRLGGFEHRHWLRADTGFPNGVRAQRPLGSNARSSLQWATGEVLCDLTTGRGVCAFDPVGVNVNGSYRVLRGDFDGNGRSDVFWYAAGPSSDHLWLATTGRRYVTSPRPVQGTYEPAVGDFDGDGADDLLWYGYGSRADTMWWGGSGGALTATSTSVSGHYFPLVGDFDGDRRDDVLWYAPGPAPDFVWYGRADRRFDSKAAPVSGGYWPVLADIDGDGRTDVIWYAPGPGADVVWFADPGRSFDSRPADLPGSWVPAVGDLDGDGRGDVVWHGPGAEPDRVTYGDGRRFTTVARSVGGTYQPVVGDFDGDGRDDVYWSGATTPHDSVWYSTPGRGYASVPAPSSAATHPSVGDQDADRHDDLLDYQPGAAADLLRFGR